MHPNRFGLQRHPRPIIDPPQEHANAERTDSPADPSGTGSSSAQDQTGSTPMPGAFPADEQHDHPHSEPYKPSVLDVLVLKTMLYKGLTLPVEIVDSIVELAEYWAHTSTTLDNGTSQSVARGSSRFADRFLLRTPPLGLIKPVDPDPDRYRTQPARPLRLSAEHSTEQFQRWIGSPDAVVQHPCRKIVFTISSNDQGWGGDLGHAGTYEGSWTWFEAGLERVDADPQCTGEDCPTHAQAAASETTTPQQQPLFTPCAMRCIVPRVADEEHESPTLEHPLHANDEYMIQCNKTATGKELTHTVEWRADDNLKLGAEPSPAVETAADELCKVGRGRLTGSGDFVRDLKLGDVVTVWAKARFPGWTNNVRRVQVDVYWAI